MNEKSFAQVAAAEEDPGVSFPCRLKFDLVAPGSRVIAVKGSGDKKDKDLAWQSSKAFRHTKYRIAVLHTGFKMTLQSESRHVLSTSAGFNRKGHCGRVRNSAERSGMHDLI